MVYGFVKQSGGAVRIDSSVGAGTRVELWLPMVEEEVHSQVIFTIADVPSETESGRSLRILLVDDHAGVRATTAAMLEDMGHDVVEAECGDSGLQMIKLAEQPFDLLISDYAMPRQSGVELLNRARLVSPGLPGIIITGYADPQSIERRPGDVAVLGKPFTAVQLAAVLQSITQDVYGVAVEPSPATNGDIPT
jgi:CheY-like chemotaxis protein